MTLRARLLAGVGLVALVLVVVSAVVTATTRAQLLDQVDDRLTQLSPDVRFFDRAPPPIVPSDGDAPPGERRDPFAERISDVYEGIVGADGVLRTFYAPNVGDRIYAPPDLENVELPATSTAVFTVDAVDGGVTYRVRAVPGPSGQTFVTALALDDVERTIERLVLVEVLGSLAILAALGVVAWWMLRLGIRPIKEMTETASRIAAGDLSERVPENAPGTEPGDLAIALNGMLGHIEHALEERAASEERLRRFVADASHELRTPVTTIRGYAELYRHGGLEEPAALADAMRRTEQEAGRMTRLIEDMLTLAKLDEERPFERRALDLAVLAGDAVDDARVVAPDRPIHLDVAPGTDTIVHGDEDRIRQVLANVVGNALVHTDPDTAIDISLEVGEGAVVVTVRDHGAGMPQEVTDRVTERFFRADPARTRHRGGSGLGLAIVDATVSAHGGSVTVDSAPGAGTTVQLSFPAG